MTIDTNIGLSLIFQILLNSDSDFSDFYCKKKQEFLTEILPTLDDKQAGVLTPKYIYEATERKHLIFPLVVVNSWAHKSYTGVEFMFVRSGPNRLVARHALIGEQIHHDFKGVPLGALREIPHAE